MRRLDRPHPTKRQLDGAWWPYGQQLQAEVGGMIEAVRSVGFDTRHVTFCGAEWSAAKNKIVVEGVKVRLGSPDSQPPHTVSLIDFSGLSRLEILVVAPETPAAVARHAMNAVAEKHGGDDPGGEVMTDAYRAVGREG